MNINLNKNFKMTFKLTVLLTLFFKSHFILLAQEKTCKDRSIHLSAAQTMDQAKAFYGLHELYDEIEVMKGDKFNFPLEIEKLSNGHIQLYADMKTKSEFLAQYPEIAKLDSKFENILSEPTHDYVLFSRQAYILKGVSPDEFGEHLFKDEDFRLWAYKNTEYDFPENKKGEDFSWIISVEVPVVGDLKSKVKYKKMDFEKLTPQQQEQITKFETHQFKPKYVVASSMHKPGTPDEDNTENFGIGADHKYFKSSVSMTSYYSVGPDLKDTLVITYQLGAVIKPWYVPGALFEKGATAFVGGTHFTVQGTRLYFSIRHSEKRP
jgi:hypothetical protein